MSRTIALLRASLDSDLAWRFRQSPPAMVAAALLLVMVFCAVAAPLIAPHTPFDPGTLNLMDSRLPPVWIDGGTMTYPLGTDEQGRDVFSAILYGLRISLTVGVLGVLFSGTLGIVLGLIAGYVGGAVDGQSAESLRIHLDSGRVRLMAQASAAVRRQVDPRGGVTTLPASGADFVLQTAEIAKLIGFVRELPSRFPAIVDAAGASAPADVEFGFVDGELRLFQLRPFLDNAAARGNQYLIDMDPTPAALAGRLVDLNDRPE